MQRAIHVGGGLLLCFALYPPVRRSVVGARIPLADFVLMAVPVIACGYIVFNYDDIVSSLEGGSLIEHVLAGALTLLVMEAARRTLGTAFTLLAAGALAYAAFGSYFPGDWGHRGFSLARILDTLYLGTNGLWGQITAASANIVAIFLVFGIFLQRTGGGEIFVDLARWMAGRSVGGPAKVSVISSSLFGTISGSAVANVVVDGIFNIPLMKKLGYKPELAAAVEATASSGGQLMPPIMGAGAFVMAELLGISYFQIALAATAPALLYYLCVGAAVHFEAKRSRRKTIPPELIPRIGEVLRRSPPFFGPVVVLLAFMGLGFTPQTAALWALATSVLMYLATVRNMRQLRAVLRGLWDTLAESGQVITVVAVLVAAAQIVVGMIGLTGLAIKFSEMLLATVGGHLMAGLLVSMVVAVILGMGMPTTAAYVLAASVMAAPLIALGVLPLAAHLFLFYFAIISAITPPVCAAVYVAATIAHANWLTTAWYAMRIGLAGFVVPYLFVFSPVLILVGEPAAVFWAVITASLGSVCLAAGTMGYFITRCTIVDTVLLLIGSLLLLTPGWTTDLPGAFVVGAVALLQWRRQRAMLSPPLATN